LKLFKEITLRNSTYP